MPSSLLMPTYNFAKYQGSGNDFIILETDSLNPAVAQFLCDRHFGIGADGVLALFEKQRLTIYNSDGHQAALCGNGLCCVGQYLLEGGYHPPFHLKIPDRFVKLELLQTRIVVSMPFTNAAWGLNLAKGLPLLHHLETGVPHAVFFTNELDALDLAGIGAKIQNHPYFQRSGTNVTAVDPTSKRLRTLERGCGETLACGSGAVAAAIALAMCYKEKSPLALTPASGMPLVVSFLEKDGDFSSIALCGNAKKVFEGSIDIPNSLLQQSALLR